MRLATKGALCVLLAVLFFPHHADAQDREYLNIAIPGQGQPARDVSVKDTWSIYCKVDELMDLRYCFINAVMEDAKYVAAHSSFTTRVNSDGTIYVWTKEGTASPGTKQILKVDENDLIHLSADHPLASRETIEQLKAGNVLHTRWYEGQSQKQYDEVVSLVGFGNAVEVARAIVEKRTIPVEPVLASTTAWEWGKMAGFLVREMNPEYDKYAEIVRSMHPELYGGKCPNLEEARAEIEKARSTLSPPYRQDFISGYTVGVSQKPGLGLKGKECDDYLRSLRLRIKNFSLLPQPPSAGQESN